MTMTSQMKKMLIIVVIIFGLIFGWYGARKAIFMYFMAHYVPPPVTISATTAKAMNWQYDLTSVGTLMAINGVDVSAEAPGIVRDIHFESGQMVHQGDLLLSLDTNVEQAELKNAQAKLALATLNFNRSQTLYRKNVNPRSMLDTHLAELKQAEASVEEVEARIKQKTITAPFEGKLGIRLVNVGEYVPAGTSMVTLQSLDPLYVRFNLPEQYLPDLYLQQPVDISVNLATRSETVPIRGMITAINSKVEQSTRNILVQATIPNPQAALYPGMYALVKIWLKEQNQVIAVPESAISYSLHGDSVFLIKAEGQDKKGNPILNTYRQYVKVGEHRGNQVIVLEGLKAGDSIVTSGQLKLQNGTHVIIDNSVEL